jgi:hypothetical protein
MVAMQPSRRAATGYTGSSEGSQARERTPPSPALAQARSSPTLTHEQARRLPRGTTPRAALAIATLG